MDTFLGIALDAWVNIDGGCDMKTEVARSEVQIELGHTTGSLHLILSEDGLAKLASVVATALRAFRAGDVTGEVAATTWATQRSPGS